MNINKAHWVTEGDNVRLSMPIGKVDAEKRIVSGFATLDNIDKQGDIVTTEASLEAFKNFRGNIREMHQSIAVGKIVSFKEDRYFDPNTKKFYSGVYVSAYISKGAQDAWEKVLDGTYTGFSIGGNIHEYDDKFDESLEKTIRVINKYDLFELSLVDNPANQFANIVSIEKVDGKNVLTGMATKSEVENVFWCKNDDIVNLSTDASVKCPSCAESMTNTGFVEKNDRENTETIKFLVDSAKGIKTIKMKKEESPMTTEDTNPVVDAPVAEEAPAVEATPEVANVEVAPEAETAEPATEGELTEKAAKPHPDKETPEEDAAEPAGAEQAEEKKPVKKSEDAADAVAEIKNTLTSAFSDLAATIKSLDEKVAELSKSLSSVTTDVAGVKDTFNEFGKRVDAVEQDTAFRKSGDLGEIVQEPVMVQKSLWGGRFLTNTDLFN